MLRRTLFLVLAVVLVQETDLGSLLLGAECFETCPDDTAPGHCTPLCATCACGSHTIPVIPPPVRVAAPVARQGQPLCEAEVPPADCVVAEIPHVPRPPAA